jgi:hypothetical protein
MGKAELLVRNTVATHACAPCGREECAPLSLSPVHLGPGLKGRQGLSERGSTLWMNRTQPGRRKEHDVARLGRAKQAGERRLLADSGTLSNTFSRWRAPKGQARRRLAGQKCSA